MTVRGSFKDPRLPVLVSGLPGAGKTCFAWWLGRRGWQVLIGDEADSWDVGVHRAWDAALAGNDVGLLLETSRHAGRLVIEWGFRPAAIGIVHGLIRRGYRAAYFDGDHATALACWKLRRPDADDTIWQAQADGLDAITEEIDGAYRSSRIQTLAPGPAHLPPEEICRRLGLEP